jgi:hypothetical protein
MSASVNAKITGYVIYYTCGSREEISINNISPEALMYTITNLGYGENCSVDLVATNKYGQKSS